MKFVDAHPFSDPDAAAHKLVEIANGVEAVQDGRIYSTAAGKRSDLPDDRGADSRQFGESVRTGHRGKSPVNKLSGEKRSWLRPSQQRRKSLR